MKLKQQRQQNQRAITTRIITFLVTCLAPITSPPLTVAQETSEVSKALPVPPPTAVSKTFIAFKKAEDEGNWEAIIDLYSPESKIVLLGPQGKTNFGFPQKAIEISKEEFKTLIDAGVVTPQKSTIVYEDLRFAQYIQEPTQELTQELTQEPTPKLKDNKQEEIVYEVRGLRKKYSDQEQKVSLNAGQFYMEIEKNVDSTLAKIRHHAWEPDPVNELSHANMNTLEDKLRHVLEPLFETLDTQSCKSQTLEAMKVSNVKNLDQVIDFIKKNQAIELLKANKKIPKNYDIKVIETQKDPNEQGGLLISQISWDGAPQILIGHRVLIIKQTEDKPIGNFGALILKHTQKLQTQTLENAKIATETVLKSVSKEEIIKKLNQTPKKPTG